MTDTIHFPSTNRSNASYIFSLPVIVAALGYFVDIYDLLLFSIVRIPSLTSLGLSEQQISTEGASILNWQMTGLLVGGILWGILGDKKGRLSVLFGSIITYSLANIACGFVHDLTTYKLLRFIAGVGLAGELGAGITLVSEILPKQLRAYGTSLVSGVGMLGAVVAFLTVKLFDWRSAYFIGGGLGLALLVLRFGIFESGMFEQVKKQTNVKRGNFLALFTKKDRLILYLKCIGIGIPIWFVNAIFTTFSNEFGKAFGIVEPINPGLAVMYSYIGISLSDFACGFISQWFRSRKKTVLLWMTFGFVSGIVYLFSGLKTPEQVYFTVFLLGLGNGYWAIFVTIAAEQFGTNLRATATTTIPNMVRGTVVLTTTLFVLLKDSFSVTHSAALVGLICFGIGFYSILTIPETHDRTLDFVEE